MRLSTLAVAVVFVLAVAARATAQAPAPFAVEPRLERAATAPGSSVRGLLRVEIPPGLHIQADRPRDTSVIPASLSFAADLQGLSVTEVVFPKATTTEVLGFTEPLDVFEGSLLVGVQFAVSRDAAPGPHVANARFRYQACDDRACYVPVTVETSWTIEVGSGAGAVRAPADRALFASIPFGTGQPPPPPFTARAATAPATTPVATSGPERAMALFDSFDLAGSQGGYLSTADFLSFIKQAESGERARGAFEGRGPLAILALVFLGGILLNLTPCVLPMIPINLAIIGAGARGGSGRGRGFLLGCVYGAAMALVYGVLGLVVVLTAGTFGTINASPWFNFGITALFIILGLAMFDVINIDFSRLSSRIQFKQESRGSVWLAFGMGGVAALLAGACVAPVVIQVIAFSSTLYAAGATAALALPFVLGLGMAMPWPLAGAGIAALPKPGAWMVRVKQAMGVFILGMAAYYGYLGYEILSNRWVDPATVSQSVQEQIKDGWHASIVEGLETAQRNRTPVLIDFWATWCKNCLVMDRTTLADASVKAALDGYTRIKFQAEDPTASPARELLRRSGGSGLPHYVILRPR